MKLKKEKLLITSEKKEKKKEGKNMLDRLVIIAGILKNIALILVLLWLILILVHIIFISYQNFCERFQGKKDKKEREGKDAE